MGILKKLFGGNTESARSWKIRPAADRPAAWSEPKPDPDKGPSKSKRSSKPESSEPNPFLDDEMLDTIQLEAESVHDANPYDTHSWKVDVDGDTRKLRNIAFNRVEKKKGDAEFNPYETGKHRRGWKD